MTKNDIVTKYLGIPYKHRGRGMDGLDCWGLAKLIYKDLGFELLDVDAEYDEDWGWQGKNYFIENYHRQWNKVTLPRPYDGVLFKNSVGAVNHGGVMLDEDQFIHAVKKFGVIVSRLSSPQWNKRLDGFYRLKVAA